MSGKFYSKNKFIFVALFIFVFFIFPHSFVHAGSTRYVNSSDGNDNGGSNDCLISTTPCKTFTRAYAAAGAGDTIDLTGTFDWSSADETGDAVTSGYTIAKSLTIQGQDAGSTFIQAASSAYTADRRIFTLNAVTVTIKNLTLRYGQTSSDYESSCITSYATLTILDSIISENSNVARFGYAPIFYSGTGKFIMRNSTVHTNNRLTSWWGYTGAISANGTNTGNEITNCTFFNNVAQYNGGIYANGPLTITNSTFISNRGDSSASDIHVWTSGKVYVKNNIFADKAGTSNLAVGSTGQFVDGGYNIIETQGAGSGFTNGVNGNLVGDQANLNISHTLAISGAANNVPTLALSAGSVAINAGNDTANNGISIPSTDQRGFSRSGAVDIGSYEFTSSYTVTYNSNSPTSGTTPSNQTKTAGVNLTLSANTGSLAKTGYTFTGWNTQANGSGTHYAESGTYSTDADLTLYAEWTINTYTLSYSAGSHGTLSGTASQTVNYGSSGSAVNAVADTGYHFVKWSDDLTDNPRTDDNVTGNISVTANFEVTDSDAPILSNVNPYVSNSGAIITWDTNENASALVNYGLDSSCKTATDETDTPSRDKSHSSTISGLVACTRYYYKAQSTDDYSNVGYYDVKTFKTLGCTGDADITATGQSTATKASGGTLTQGDIALSIPASFKNSASSATFQANKLDNGDFSKTAGTPNGHTQVGTNVYTLKALTNEATSISSFDADINVTMSYTTDSIAGLDESSLWIYRYDDGAGWVALDGCKVDTSAKTVSCTTKNFSDFALFGTAQPISVNSPALHGSSSGGSVQSQVANLTAMGKIQEAENIKKRWPNLFQDQSNSQASSSAVLTNVLSLNNSSTSTISNSQNYSEPYSRDLTIGSEGSDVARLQQFLIKQNKGPTAKELSRVGATGYFGNYTKNALAEFQKALGIRPWIGYLGPITRAFIEKIK